MDNQEDDIGQAILYGLLQLGCETLNNLFKMNPLDMIRLQPTYFPASEDSILGFLDIYRSLLLFDWCACQTESGDKLRVLRHGCQDEQHSTNDCLKVQLVPCFEIDTTLVYVFKPSSPGLLPKQSQLSIKSKITYTFRYDCRDDFKSDKIKHYTTANVCDGIYYPLDEPDCHIGWCRKLYYAMTTFNITKLMIPDH